VSAHNSRNKRRFPSQLLTQHIRANSHAYQTCQPTNGRADEQRENHIKRPWFQPKDYSFNIGIQQKTHLQDYSSKHQESPQQYQEGPVRSLHVKTDSQSVSGGVIWSVTAKGVGLSVTVQKGVTLFDAQAARHPMRARRLPCRQPISILHGPDHQPSSHYQPLVSRSLVESELPADHHQRASSAAICPSSTRAGALHIQS